MQNITIHFIYCFFIMRIYVHSNICYTVLVAFVDTVFVTFAGTVFVMFVDVLSLTFIISSYTIMESSAILFK